MGNAKSEPEVPKYRKRKVQGKVVVECRWKNNWNPTEPLWGTWRAWSHYKSLGAAEKALADLAKHKYEFIEFRLKE